MRSGGRPPARTVPRTGAEELTAAAERTLSGGDGSGLGLEAETVTGPVAAYYTSKDCPTVPGAQVCAVDDKGAAALAGVAPGDVITAFDGEEILSAEALRDAAEKCEPGREVSLTVYRAGAYITLTAVLSPPGP